MAGERSAELLQSAYQPTRVLLLRSNEDLEVSSGSGHAVNGKRMGSDDDESHVGLPQSHEEILEVVVKSRFAQSETPERRSLPGMSPRS